MTRVTDGLRAYSGASRWTIADAVADVDAVAVVVADAPATVLGADIVSLVVEAMAGNKCDPAAEVHDTQGAASREQLQRRQPRRPPHAHKFRYTFAIARREGKRGDFSRSSDARW